MQLLWSPNKIQEVETDVMLFLALVQWMDIGTGPFCGCWGLRPGRLERQQQLRRQREHRRCGPAEILLLSPPEP